MSIDIFRQDGKVQQLKNRYLVLTQSGPNGLILHGQFATPVHAEEAARECSKDGQIAIVVKAETVFCTETDPR